MGAPEIYADRRRYCRTRCSGVHSHTARFHPDTAWQIGTTLRDLAMARNLSIVVDVRRFGSPHQQLFYCALAGTTPDNQRWVARKINVVARFHKSSYHIGRLLAQSGLAFPDRYNLPLKLRPPRRLLPHPCRGLRHRWRGHCLSACPNAKTITLWWKLSASSPVATTRHCAFRPDRFVAY